MKHLLCVLFKVCNYAVDPLENSSLFLGLERTANDGKSTLDVKNFVVNGVVLCNLRKNLLNSVCSSIVAVNHQGNVLCAHLGKLLAEQTERILNMLTLSGEDQNNDSFFVAPRS